MVTRRGRAALALLLATAVVAVLHSVWYVLSIQAPLGIVRSDGWWIGAILTSVVGNLGLGLLPASVAFGIFAVRPDSLVFRIAAVIVSNIVGAYAAFWVFSQGYALSSVAFQQAAMYLLLGVPCYSLALLFVPLGDKKTLSRGP